MKLRQKIDNYMEKINKNERIDNEVNLNNF